MQLHPQPDAILAVNAILGSASPYFCVLLQSDFKEGVETRRGNCPTIVLGDDNPVAMGVMLSLLHGQHTDVYEDMDPWALAAVALHSDKYICGRVLAPLLSPVLRKLGQTNNIYILSYLLLAAFLLQSGEDFSLISIQLITNATLTDLASLFPTEDLFALISKRLKKRIKETIISRVRETHSEIDAAIRTHQPFKLSKLETSFIWCDTEAPTSSWYMFKCLAGTDSYTVHHSKRCRHESLTGDYYPTLRRADVLRPFKRVSIAEIAWCIAVARDEQTR
ncbi:hypothetical protein N0V88_007730 [Collariella sp. IMI 366227]|nr:hypothetical protein N0V88_007730 [Collariella sp. IMI 366227]